MRRRWLLWIVLLAATGPALGWNPVERREGPPLRWDVTTPVVWNPDGGPLGLLSQVEATVMVHNGFDVWEAEPSATIAFTRGGPIVDASGTPVDVTADNFFEIIDLDNGQNPVIFDNDQEIWAALGVSTSVLGFAGELRTEGAIVTKGFVALQGDWIDAVEIRPPNCGNERCDPELPEVEQYLNIVVHEIGHFVGLGHSSVNHEAGSVRGCPAPGIDHFETMSPLAHYAMADLHYDDVIGLSTLYPSTAFLTAPARISGRLVDRDGVTPFDGGNVILRPDTADCNLLYGRAQATQSGVNPFENGGPGTYRFTGLDPATGYTLYVTEIDDGGSYPIGGSSPPSLGAPPEFHNGPDEDHFDPPDAPFDFVTLTTGIAGTELSGRDIELNNPGGPGAVDDAGARALRLGKTDEGSIVLSWGDACNAQLVPDQDYAVYAGSLDTVAGVQDHQPVACGTAGSRSLQVEVATQDRYFLVSPLLAGREGDLGTGSSGRGREPLVTCAEIRPDPCP